jgi:hypothetical protein
MDKTTHLLKRAIALVREEKPGDARRILNVILQDQPDHWEAWTWYYETCQDDDDRIHALENLLRINPRHAGIQRKLLALLQKKNAESKSAPPRAASAFPRSLAFLLAGAIIIIMVLAVRNVQASDRIQELTGTNNFLSQQYTTLIYAHNELQGNYSALQGDYKSLQTERDRLNLEFGNLQSVHNQLQGEFTSLQLEFENLRSQNAFLNQQFSSLESKAIVPPYIYIRGREVLNAFEKTTGETIYWKTPFEGLESDLKRGNAIREQIDRERALLQLGQTDRISSGNWLVLPFPKMGQNLYVVDERIFVDPDEFSKVIPELYAAARSEYEFIYEIWNLIAQLTVYSTEITDTPRYPLETLLAGGGDCEDTAILFASMILAAPVEWDVYIVYMDGYNPYDPVEMNHVIVFIETDRSSYSIETTSKTVMDPYQGRVNGWYYKINR